MIGDSHNMDDIFDEFERDKDSIWDIISLFENGRNIYELKKILKQRPHLARDILYIMRELTSNVVLPIWRSAIPYLSSDDFNSVYYALDTVHAVLPHVSTEEVLSLLGEVRVSEESIDRKIQAITEALNERKGR